VKKASVKTNREGKRGKKQLRKLRTSLIKLRGRGRGPGVRIYSWNTGKTI